MISSESSKQTLKERRLPMIKLVLLFAILLTLYIGSDAEKRYTDDENRFDRKDFDRKDFDLKDLSLNGLNSKGGTVL
jgi:hypothetical protein